MKETKHANTTKWERDNYEPSEILSKYISNHFARNDQIRKSNYEKIIDTLLGNTEQVIIGTY